MVASGLSHMTFIVRDLDRMEQILIRVLGAVRIYDSGPASNSLSPERFFFVGEESQPLWIAIMQGEGELPKTYNHIAFKISEDRLPQALNEIQGLNLTTIPSRPRQTGEAQSIYFLDDDNHLFELHTGTVEERLAAYESKRTGNYLKI